MVYAMKFDKGRHKLDVHGKGSFVILGVIPQTAQLTKRDARRGAGGQLDFVARVFNPCPSLR